MVVIETIDESVTNFVKRSCVLNWDKHAIEEASIDNYGFSWHINEIIGINKFSRLRANHKSLLKSGIDNLKGCEFLWLSKAMLS